MSNAKRPSTQRQHTRTTEAKRSDELERGVAFTDTDGARLQVRLGDVRGSHDAALVRAVGLDFMGLLEATTKRQGLDLLAAVVWFGRLVNGRDAGTYEETLESFGYGDLEAMGLDEAKPEDNGPEA